MGKKVNPSIKIYIKQQIDPHLKLKQDIILNF